MMVYQDIAILIVTKRGSGYLLIYDNNICIKSDKRIAPGFDHLVFRFLVIYAFYTYNR